MQIINEKGSAVISENTYPVSAATVLKRGQAVKLVNGELVTVSNSESGPVLGICLEFHPAGESAKVKVADGPQLVYACPAPRISVSSSAGKTVSDSSSAQFADDAFNGGMLVLVSKTSHSANTCELGRAYAIVDYEGGGRTFTLDTESDIQASAGDKYNVYPPIGASIGALTGASALTIRSAASDFSFRVVGWDTEHGKVLLMANRHFFGNRN